MNDRIVRHVIIPLSIATAASLAGYLTPALLLPNLLIPDAQRAQLTQLRAQHARDTADSLENADVSVKIADDLINDPYWSTQKCFVTKVDFGKNIARVTQGKVHYLPNQIGDQKEVQDCLRNAANEMLSFDSRLQNKELIKMMQKAMGGLVGVIALVGSFALSFRPSRKNVPAPGPGTLY